ncbi:MAG: class I SAM-dependent methyltransferase [Rhodoferax sp.]|nr:class I SAM-dependent methyltransferase [Rhodoferax sp.]
MSFEGPPREAITPSGGSEPRAAGSMGAHTSFEGPPREAITPSGGSEPRTAGSMGAHTSFEGPPQAGTAPTGGSEPERAFSLAAERLLLGRMLASVGNPPLRVLLWDGQEIGDSANPQAPRLVIADRAALLKLMADPEYRFGELYVTRRIDVQGDLCEFLEILFRALPRPRTMGMKERLLAPLRVRRNPPQRALENIHHHYDIGNPFYRLWLDPQLVYTCAYFADPQATLEQAQIGKMDYICRKLRLRPGETVVEAGCGWGALALHMARHHGVRVRAYNLSGEQLEHARAQAREQGLQDRVEFVQRDYRTIDGRFDAFVSVGMLEHVGLDDYAELGALIHRCLAPQGRGLIHSIGRDQAGSMNAWIERHIFPGACPPSLSQMMTLFEPNGLSVLDVENLRLHYARTLEHWLSRFDAASAQVQQLFDADFVRTWRLYLAGSLASFRAGDLQLYQVAFSRNGCNHIPWSRHDLYATNGSADATL